MTITAVVQMLVFSILVAGLVATIAAGISLVLGVTGIVNFAHGEFVMLGAYLTYWLYVLYGISPYISALISFVSMGVLSYVVFRVFLHRVLQAEHHNQLIATFGLSILLSNLAMLAFTPALRSISVEMLPTVKLGPIIIPGNFLFVGIMGMVCYLLLIYLVSRTSYGVMMRMTSSHPELANYSGVNVFQAFALSFVIGGAFAGAAGSMVAVLLYIHPAVGLGLGIKSFAVVVASGIGSVPAAILGALIVCLAEGMVSTFLSQGASWAYGVGFLILMLILIFKPTGILGKKL